MDANRFIQKVSMDYLYDYPYDADWWYIAHNYNVLTPKQRGDILDRVGYLVPENTTHDRKSEGT